MYSNVNQQKRSIDYGGQPQWSGPSEDGCSSNGGPEKKKKRKSRWGAEDIQEKIVIPGMPTVIPANLSKEQEQQYLLHLQIEEISRRLRTGDLGIPVNPEDRSPSPEPIYNTEGKRLNTREYRTRKQLEEDRHRLVQEALALNSDYKPPADYKPPMIRVNDRVMIPQEEHPDINFVGLLIGPRGNTLKNLEKETGAKIIIRGKGSVKDGKIGRKDGQPLPGEDEPLHAYVTANNPEFVKKAVEKIKSIIKESVEVPEGQNDLRKQQLRELALLNGTLRENDGLSKLKQIAQAQTIVTNTIICQNCGGAGHLSKDCKQGKPGDTFSLMQQQHETSTDKAKMDSEYLSLMAELGQGPPPPKQTNNLLPQRPVFQQQQQQQQLHITQPPPNPMGGFTNFQTNRPPPSMVTMNNTRPPMNIVQNPIYHHTIQQQQPAYHGIQSQNQLHSQQIQGGLSQFQPHVSAPQPVAPLGSISSQYPPPSIQQMSSPMPVSPVPPPNTFSAPVQPPNTLNTPVPPPNTFSAPVQPPNTFSAPVPPPNTFSAPVPPLNTFSAPVQPLNTFSAPVQPPNTFSAPVPPPNTFSATVPPPNTFSAPVPPPNTFSAPVPPPNTFSAPVPPPSWTSAVTMSQMNTIQTQPPRMTMGVPPPPTAVMVAPPPLTVMMSAPPPPPPSITQLHSVSPMPWLQPGAVPPPPPTQTTWQPTVPPPPSVSISLPWQQVPLPSMPSTVVPPPPPPITVQAFNMPPPPPGRYDPSQMSGVKQLFVPPPPPPPN